jgi:hypothetical protein
MLCLLVLATTAGTMSALSHSTASVLTEPTVTGAADECSAPADSDAVTSDTVQDALDASAAAAAIESTLQLPAVITATTATAAATAGGLDSGSVNEQAELHSSAILDVADSDSVADDAGSEWGDYVPDLRHSASAQLMLLRQAEAAAATASSPAAGRAPRHTLVLSPL